MTHSMRVPMLGCVHIGNLGKMRSFLRESLLYSLAFNKQLNIMIRKSRLQKCIYIIVPLEWLHVLGILTMVIQWNFLFSCLFGVLRPTSRFFHSYKDVTITGEGLQILTCAGTYGHWAVTVYSVSHLRWHVASIHTGHTRTRDTHTYCGAFWQWTCHYLLRSVAARNPTPIFRGERSYRHDLTELNWLLIYCFQRADNVWMDHKQEIANLYEDGSEDLEYKEVGACFGQMMYIWFWLYLYITF